jgi:hypothetical protein
VASRRWPKASKFMLTSTAPAALVTSATLPRWSRCGYCVVIEPLLGRVYSVTACPPTWI